LDLKAAEEKEKFAKVISDRKRELDIKESQLTQEQKNIREVTFFEFGFPLKITSHIINF